MHQVVRVWMWLAGGYRNRVSTEEVDPESGQAVNEWLGLSALAIVAIVAIGAGLKALGVDIVDWIRGQLGL